MFGISPLSLSAICDARTFGGDFRVQYIISMSLTYCNVILDIPTRLQDCVSFSILYFTFINHLIHWCIVPLSCPDYFKCILTCILLLLTKRKQFAGDEISLTV